MLALLSCFGPEIRVCIATFVALCIVIVRIVTSYIRASFVSLLPSWQCPNSVFSPGNLLFDKCLG